MNLDKTTKPIQYIDTGKMSKKEKDEVIKQLQNGIYRLQTELIIRKSVDNRYIDGLLQNKYNEITRLMNNPILTLPSGAQISFNSLSPEQLAYLEELSQKSNNIQKKYNNCIQEKTTYKSKLPNER